MAQHKNETNSHRTARALQSRSTLTYQQARALLAAAPARPDLSDAALDAFLHAHAPTALAASRAPSTVRVVIDDEIGHTDEPMLTADLPPHLREALTHTAPGATVTWAAPDGGTWTVTRPAPPSLTWAGAGLTFPDRAAGNPGCDDCGVEDAVVRSGGRYLCSSAAQSAGLDVPQHLLCAWTCDECSAVITATGGVSDEHTRACSLHTDNVSG